MSRASRQPNIVLINCDDLGYGDLGCYGSTRNHTPHVDRLAAEGMRFTDFYMASPLCSASRAAMLTGCYPPRIGLGSFDPRHPWVLFPGDAMGLSTDEATLGTQLKRAGYRTLCVGKWHCGDQPEFLPTRHGFDDYYGLPYSNDMGRQINQGHAFPPLPLMDGEWVIQQQPDQAGLTERYVERCVRFMRERRDGPFFLYLAHMYVHLPLFVPPSFEKQSRNGRYGAAVACIDWALGVLMDELRRLGLDDDTLVMFTSDNGSRCAGGGGSNAPLRGGKGTCWEGGQRLPFIARWPGRVPAGVTCDRLASALDLMPTLSAIAGVALASDRVIDGVDIGPLLHGGGGEGPRETFCYYLLNELHAVRHRDWKLHVWRDDAPVLELYNLRDDPGETRDLAKEQPGWVERLRRIADDIRRDIGDSATGMSGRNTRPCGRVEHPRTLTVRDDHHPYLVAEYDLDECG